MIDDMLFFSCLICGGEDIISEDGRSCGFCSDCLDLCDSIGVGDSDIDSLEDYIDFD